MPGIWTEFEKINQDVIIGAVHVRFRIPVQFLRTQLANCVPDKTLSFFVGDAAGRPRDHNDSDRKWALNVGIPFFTPEVMFSSVWDDSYDPNQSLTAI